MVGHGPYTAWFYQNMQLPPNFKPALQHCYPAIVRGLPYTAVHARIEGDWYPYCRKRGRRTRGSKACYTPLEIATAMVSMPDNSVTPCAGRLLEDTAGLLRPVTTPPPLFFRHPSKNGRSNPSVTSRCGSHSPRVLLTCALVMTSSHSQAGTFRTTSNPPSPLLDRPDLTVLIYGTPARQFKVGSGAHPLEIKWPVS